MQKNMFWLQLQACVRNEIPLWIKLPYTLVALIVLPIYWYEYGPANFLWFSDIAFFLMVPALWFKNRFISSMMAIGVLPLEFLWVTSLLTHGYFLGMADYMFDEALPLWLRGLSLFHFLMIAAIIYMIRRFGYDARALYPQIILSLVVILLTHSVGKDSENINIIFPPKGVEDLISREIYILLMPVVLVSCVIIPTHFLLKKIAPLKDG